MPLLEFDIASPPLTSARHLAYLARAVYSDEPVMDFARLSQSFDQTLVLRTEKVFGLVASKDDHVAVAFRGRHENQRMLESLGYGQVPWVRGKAHGGMVRLLDTVWRDLLAAFFDVGAHDKKLWLTGHSLGGSLAVLAAQRLGHDGFDPHMVVTFGAPPVLDPVAATAFDTELYRFVNNEDAIPNLKWPTLFDTYEHVGEEVFLLPSGDIAEKRHAPHLARRLDRAHHIGEGIFPSGVFHDHSMGAYLEKIERHVHAGD